MDRRYWDSDCFLGWLKGEPDKAESCRQVLEAAEEGKILLVTSALAIAEVLNLKGKPPLPKKQKQQVKNFFRNDYIAVQNVTRRVAEEAREYVWEHGIAPKDAIHVATAVAARLSLLNTFDEGLIKKTGIVGNPALVIEPPAVNDPKLPLKGSGENDSE